MGTGTWWWTNSKSIQGQVFRDFFKGESNLISDILKSIQDADFVKNSKLIWNPPHFPKLPHMAATDKMLRGKFWNY